MGSGQNINIRLIPTIMDNLKGFKTPVEEATADVVEIAQELEVEREDVIGLLQSPDQIGVDKELLLVDEQRVIS